MWASGEGRELQLDAFPPPLPPSTLPQVISVISGSDSHPIPCFKTFLKEVCSRHKSAPTQASSDGLGFGSQLLLLMLMQVAKPPDLLRQIEPPWVVNNLLSPKLGLELLWKICIKAHGGLMIESLSSTVRMSDRVRGEREGGNSFYEIIQA